MNASDRLENIPLATLLASAGTLVRNYFPSASLNLSPWRDDPQTRHWFEEETIDLAFHFPGWSPRLQCRSILIELRVSKEAQLTLPPLVGVIIRGVTFSGERWKLATVGDWQATGSHLPQAREINQLQCICRDFFALFPSYSF